MRSVEIISTYFEIADYWEYLFGQTDYKDIFKERLTRNEKKKLFAKYVLNINIETSAFCNRKCEYCPLKTIERKQDFITDNHWELIMSELEEIGYKGRITLCLYNEPLLDLSLNDKIREIRKRLPETKICLYSNGDYLTEEKLEELSFSGLNWMLITRHVEGEFFDIERCKIKNGQYIKKLGLDNYITGYRELNRNNVSYLLMYKSLELYIVTNNWSVTGCDRGGEIESLKAPMVREQPCAKAIRDFNIAYNGVVKSCCNIYFGKNADFGNIETNGILDSYFDNLRMFRREMFRYGKKAGGCKYCNEPDNSNPNTMLEREAILQR